MCEQTTNHVLMVYPRSIAYNEETASDNVFQVRLDKPPAELRKIAQQEFEATVKNLRDHGIHVTLYTSNDPQEKPDEIFPNNWVSFHADGSIVTYPMRAPGRRMERDEAIILQLEETFCINQRFSLEQHEKEDKFLEGTGSIILDRENKIAYACLSKRTNEEILEEFCLLKGYRSIVFHAIDGQGKEIYHTNIVLSIGKNFAVVCFECVKNEEERMLLKTSLEATKKEIVDISLNQVKAFAGNMLELKGKTPVLAMSTQAYNAFTDEQKTVLEKHGTIVHTPIPTIEACGGGSMRCIMAEIFNEKQ